MRLSAPSAAPQTGMIDIDGKPVAIGAGRRTLLCFFRDAACPFCNLRVFELTEHHKALSALGLHVIAVFASTTEDVRRFVCKHPRPFTVVAEPARRSYESYGIESSFWRKLKAIAFRFGSALRGLRKVGLAGLRTNNLMPADFLIDEDGLIVEAYYGRDAGDHIPLERIELFLARGLIEGKARQVP